MRLSTRGRYAVTAMTDMARRGAAAGGPAVSLHDIASAQSLSPTYLEQIFGRLRRAGLLHAARGPGGGYRLARIPAAISVAEVVEAVEDSIMGRPALQEDDAMPADQRDLWLALAEQVRHFLSAISIQDVADGHTMGRVVPIPPVTAPEEP